MALERPAFVVERKVDGIEYRRYEPYQIAECHFESLDDLNAASNAGFNYLFRYISGDNASSQKISMTVPVQQMPTDSGWAISFVVPRSFYENGAPIPTNPNVAIRKIDGGLVAALVYRGFWNNEVFERKREELLKRVAAAGEKPIGEVFSAVYNPPMTPTFLRHNEVLVRLA